jgi:exopolysaccharide production protein ExoZ
MASKLLPLELCRDLAEILVTFVHVGASIEKRLRFEIGLVHNFGASVDFVFVLSGFDMIYAHWHDVGGPERVRGYYILRIYPPYLIVTAAIVLFYILVLSYEGLGRLGPAKLFCSILLLPYTTQPVVGQAWTR